MRGKKIANNDRGSTVVEVSLIMPVIISIIIIVVFLFLDVINDAVIQGESYSQIYALSIGDCKDNIESELSMEIKDKIIGAGNSAVVGISVKSGEISAHIKIEENENGIYDYQASDKMYKREYDKCTQRLRRWQMYGDTLRE